MDAKTQQVAIGDSQAQIVVEKTLAEMNPELICEHIRRHPDAFLKIAIEIVRGHWVGLSEWNGLGVQYPAIINMDGVTVIGADGKILVAPTQQIVQHTGVVTGAVQTTGQVVTTLAVTPAVTSVNTAPAVTTAPVAAVQPTATIQSASGQLAFVPPPATVSAVTAPVTASVTAPVTSTPITAVPTATGTKVNITIT
jgi:hypothetical protein